MPDDLQEQQDQADEKAQNYLSPRQLLLGLRKLIARRKASRYERLQQKKRSKAIDQALQEDWKRSSRQCSILLLGVDHSSRSELIEIVKTYSQGNYTAEELAGYRLSVYKSLVDFAKALIDAMEQFGILPEKQENLAGCTYLKEFTVDPDPNKPFEPKASVAINALWKDPCIARVLEHSEVNALPRSALYLFDAALRIADPDYLPTEADVDHARREEIYESRFSMRDISIHMLDFGPRRTQMQKWIHCFQDVTTVIFVADIANYDQILFDDESYTRFTETLVLFESVVNSRWFQRNSVMLFLNNVQEFRGKLGSSPLANYFPDYSGGSDYAKAADYVLKLFMSKVTRRPNTIIYPHFTQSSDLALMRLVFSAVVDIIVSENLAARVRYSNL